MSAFDDDLNNYDSDGFEDFADGDEPPPDAVLCDYCHEWNHEIDCTLTETGMVVCEHCGPSVCELCGVVKGLEGSCNCLDYTSNCLDPKCHYCQHALERAVDNEPIDSESKSD